MAQRVMLAFLTGFILILTQTTDAVAGTDITIRALRGVVSPSGIPPFTASALVLLGIALIIWYRRQTKLQTPAESKVQRYQRSPGYLLEQLIMEARQKHLTPADIFERLVPIIRRYFAEKSGTSSTCHTSQELIASLQRTCEAGVLLQLDALLLLCDSVRFGGVVPTAGQIDRALQETLQLLQDYRDISL
jgi:hypothetical protein